MFYSRPPPKRLLHSTTSRVSTPMTQTRSRTRPNRPLWTRLQQSRSECNQFFLRFFLTGCTLLSARTVTRSKATLSLLSCNKRVRPTTRRPINNRARNNICNLPDCCLDRAARSSARSWGRSPLISTKNVGFNRSKTGFRRFFSVAGNRRLCPLASWRDNSEQRPYKYGSLKTSVLIDRLCGASAGEQRTSAHKLQMRDMWRFGGCSMTSFDRLENKLIFFIAN